MERDQENPDRRILSLAKSNYSKIGTEISISWENGVFKHDTTLFRFGCQGGEQ